MTALLAFQFEEQSVRIVMIAGEPWWVANDLALALGYTRAPDMVRILDEDEKGVHNVHTLGGSQEMSVISESGMYHASFKSRKEVAVRFRKWVTNDLLPTLRRTGKYEMPGFEPPPAQALDLDPIRLSAGANVVRLAIRLYGPQAARSLWAQVGLPPVTPDSEGVLDADPFAVPLRAYLADRQETTIQQAADGIGLSDIDWSTRCRIGRILSLWGWTAANRKVARGKTARVFTRPAPAASEIVIEQGAPK